MCTCKKAREFGFEHGGKFAWVLFEVENTDKDLPINKVAVWRTIGHLSNITIFCITYDLSMYNHQNQNNTSKKKK
jgi:hypothetical protein